MRKMASVLLVIVVPAILLGSTRVYDVDVYANSNAWTHPYEAVSEVFVSLVDSEFTYVDWFVGAANAGGQYYFTIRPSINGTILYDGYADAGELVHYQYVRANLINEAQIPIIKGKEYVLTVTLSGSDSINYYYDPNSPYAYGHMKVGNEDRPGWDLCARVEGVCYNDPEMLGTWDLNPDIAAPSGSHTMPPKP